MIGVCVLFRAHQSQSVPDCLGAGGPCAMESPSRCDEWYCTTNDLVPIFMNLLLVNFVIERLENWILVPVNKRNH